MIGTDAPGFHIATIAAGATVDRQVRRLWDTRNREAIGRFGPGELYLMSHARERGALKLFLFEARELSDPRKYPLRSWNIPIRRI